MSGSGCLLAIVGWQDTVTFSQEVAARVGEARWPYLVLGLVFQLLELGAAARAWQTLLRAVYPARRVQYSGVLGSYLGGIGASVVVPGKGGELVRLSLVRRRITGSSYPGLVASLAIEGIFDLLFTGLLVAGAVLLGPAVAIRLLHLASTRVLVTIACAIGVVGLVAAVVLVLASMRDQLRRVRRSLTPVAKHRSLLLCALGWQALSWTLRLGLVYWLLLAFHISATPGSALLVVVAQIVSGLVPFAPGAAGAQQALLVLALAGTAPAGAAFAFGLGSQLLTAALDVALGTTAVAVMSKTLRWHKHASDEADAFA